MNVALVHPAWRTPNQLDFFYPGRVYWTLTLKEFFSRNTSTGVRLMNVALVHPAWRTPNQLDSFYPGRVYWTLTLKEFFFQEHINWRQTHECSTSAPRVADIKSVGFFLSGSCMLGLHTKRVFSGTH